MRIVLQVLEGPDADRVFTYDGYHSFTVGRPAVDGSSGVHPSDPYMSRPHFLLVIAGNECKIRDLDSSNGTWVNGERIEEATLRHGDWLKAGRSKMVFRVVESDSATTATRDVHQDSAAFGYELSDFDIISPVEAPSTTDVYRARVHDTGQEIALKLLDLGAPGQDQRIEYFLREISITSRLDHPNIVPVVSAGRSTDSLWLATAWVEGMDLGVLIEREGRLSVSDAVAVGTQTLDAVIEAHARDIVHRDLKPANILIRAPTSPIHAVVADFGFAKSLRSELSPRLTASGQILGTPYFMSPEQVEDAKATGPTSDVFGVGATLYHALTRAWHYGEFVGNIWKTIVTGQVVPLSSRRPDIPTDLALVIEKSLSRRQEDRFKTARHMRTALLSSVE